jgi:hypothetical protein
VAGGPQYLEYLGFLLFGGMVIGILLYRPKNKIDRIKNK